MKAVKEIWVRSAQAMGADDRRLFVKVIVPGALPYILDRPAAWPGAGLAHPGRHRDAGRRAVGPRLDDLRRARIPQHRRHAGRRRSSSACSALALEKLVFQKLEEYTVMRWGMMTMIALSDRTRSTLRATVTIVVALRALRGRRAHRLFPAGADADAAEGLERADRLADGRQHDRARGRHALSRAGRARPRRRGRHAARHPDGPLQADREFLHAAGQRADADPLARLGAAVHPVVRARQHGGDPDRVLRGAVPDAAQHLVGRARGQSAVAARRRRHGRRREARCSGR